MRNQGSGSLKRLSDLQMGHFKVIVNQNVTWKLDFRTYQFFGINLVRKWYGIPFFADCCFVEADLRPSS